LFLLPFDKQSFTIDEPSGIETKLNPKMKIILAGTTGFVGTEVLAQALADPRITSLVVLSRKPLPQSITENEKVTVKILDDFLTYPDSLLEELAGAEGCIWFVPYLLSFLNHSRQGPGYRFTFLTYHQSGAELDPRSPSSSWILIP
jgi:hypothetical protein